MLVSLFIFYIQRIDPWPILSISRVVNVCIYVPFPCPGPRGAKQINSSPRPPNLVFSFFFFKSPFCGGGKQIVLVLLSANVGRFFVYRLRDFYNEYHYVLSSGFNTALDSGCDTATYWSLSTSILGYVVYDNSLREREMTSLYAVPVFSHTSYPWSLARFSLYITATLGRIPLKKNMQKDKFFLHKQGLSQISVTKFFWRLAQKRNLQKKTT